MRHFICAILIGMPMSLSAEDLNWMPMDGEEIREALTDRVLRYGTSWQDFRASGRTLYNAGADSWGYWQVQNDQYCSQWPPSDLWACYAMDRRGDTLRFVSQAGDMIEAVYREQQ